MSMVGDSNKASDARNVAGTTPHGTGNTSHAEATANAVVSAARTHLANDSGASTPVAGGLTYLHRNIDTDDKLGDFSNTADGAIAMDLTNWAKDGKTDTLPQLKRPVTDKAMAMALTNLATEEADELDLDNLDNSPTALAKLVKHASGDAMAMALTNLATEEADELNLGNLDTALAKLVKHASDGAIAMALTNLDEDGNKDAVALLVGKASDTSVAMALDNLATEEADELNLGNLDTALAKLVKHASDGAMTMALTNLAKDGNEDALAKLVEYASDDAMTKALTNLDKDAAELLIKATLSDLDKFLDTEEADDNREK